MPKLYAEFFGALVFTIVVGISSDPFAVGLLLSAMIYVTIHISDSHFNPAVSLAAWMLGEISLFEFAAFIIAQLTGATVAAAFVWWLSGTTFITEPAQNTHTFEFIAIELVFTALFVMVFLAMMYAKRRRNPVFGLVIGLSFTGCYMVSQTISGTGLNPAMNTAYIFFDWMNSGYSYYYLPIYILAPLTGAVAAAFGFKALNDQMN